MESSSLELVPRVFWSSALYCSIAIVVHMISVAFRPSDVKPSNFLVNTQGHVKLCDFGVSRQVTINCFCYSSCFHASVCHSGGFRGVHWVQMNPPTPLPPPAGTLDVLIYTRESFANPCKLYRDLQKCTLPASNPGSATVSVVIKSWVRQTGFS